MDGPPAGDPRFYARSGPYSIPDLVHASGGHAACSTLMVNGIAPLDTAGPNDVSSLHDRRYAQALATTRAGVVVVHPDMAGQVPASAVVLAVAATYEGWARIARMFHPVPPLHPGIHLLALVSPGATIDPAAEIGPFCCIEAGASIGPGTRIGPYAHIGEGVQIGRDARIGPHCSLSHTILGDRVVLHPGVRIGQEGFSFAHTKTGFLTIPQLGQVLIEDDVEVGANSTIDRGSVQNTIIGAGTRIDNLVQIGHNVHIGRCCVIVAQVGISGSTVLEDFVQVGGQAAFTGHIRVGKGAQVGAQAGVIGDVAAGAVVLGSPALPRGEFFRGIATLRRLARPKR